MDDDYTRNNPRDSKRTKDDKYFWQHDSQPFVYRDHTGRRIFEVQREVGYLNKSHSQPAIDKATGKQIKRNPQKWYHTPKNLKPDDAPALLYLLPELIVAVRAGHTIYIAEGERKVEALCRWGLTATCNDGGAGKWRREHAAPLYGADVVVLPDNDAPGRRHADLIGRSLEGIAATCRLLELPGLPEHGDIIDWIAVGGTQAEFERLVAKASKWKPYGADSLGLIHGADLKPEWQRWLWYGRVPCGTLTLLVGLPEVGKSQLYCYLCACITTGRGLPPDDIDRSNMALPADVLIVCTEDRLRQTLVPRLIAAGANMNRVHFLRFVPGANGKPRGLDLTQDIEQVRATLAAHPNITLLVLDPLSEFIGIKIDSHNTSMVRATLGPLMEMLDSSGSEVATLGVSHLAKSKSGAVQTAAIGSVGFSACARSSLLAMAEEEEVEDDDGKPTKQLTGRMLLTVNKGNLAKSEDKQTLVYKIVGHELEEHDDIPISRIEWCGVADVSAYQLWQGMTKSNKPTQQDNAIKLIKQMMRDPKRPKEWRDRLSKEMEDAATKAGISDSTLKRAKEKLKIRSVQNGGVGPWYWEVPNQWRTNF